MTVADAKAMLLKAHVHDAGEEALTKALKVINQVNEAFEGTWNAMPLTEDQQKSLRNCRSFHRIWRDFLSFRRP